MFHDFKIILDSPPRGFYTYEDEVSGRIIFESSHEEKIGWVYVFFHGWVHAQIFRTKDLQGHIHNYPLKEKQKEILIQTHLKLYESNEKLRKKFRYEWPFTFSFQDEEGKGETLPTSGKYLYEEDQNAHCSVEYKVVVVRGDIGQMDNHVRSMLDPGDPRCREEGYGESAGFLTRLREKMNGATEQQLRFVQIRANAPIDQSMRRSSSTGLNIASHQLPHIKDPQDYDYRAPIFDDVIFVFDIQIPRNIIIGEAFPLLLSVSSLSELWNQNPPGVILTSFKLGAWIEDIATINGRSDEELKLHPVGERKHLEVPLSVESVDLGTIYGFTLAGDGIVPSFHTNLLERKYSFRAEFTAEVARKVYPVLISINIEGQVLSPLIATKIEAVPRKKHIYHPKPRTDLARPSHQRDTTSLKLQRTHIGRFLQQVESAHGDQSIMEAAIALSKVFTEAGVEHSFPGDFTMELLLYIDYDESFAPSSDDVGKLQRLFAQKGSQFQVLPFSKSDTLEIQLLFKGFGVSEIETVVVFSGDMRNAKEDSASNFPKEGKTFQQTMKLTPVSLFNHRLWIMANHEGTDFGGVDDIDHLAKGFLRELRQHRKNISSVYAKEALCRNPDLENSFTKIGVSLKVRKGKQHSRDDEELPPYAEDAGESGIKEIGNRVGEISLQREGK